MDPAAVEELLARLAPLGELRARRMFGAVGLYCDELFFGLVEAEVLYFRVDAATAGDYLAAGSAPFQPVPGKASSSYYEVPLGVQERDEELCRWARRALEAARRHAATRARAKPRARRKLRSSARAAPEAVPVARLQNIGPRSAAWLRAAGIETRADLERLGSVGAYRRVLATGVEPTLHLLYALEGALLELRWDRLPEVVRQNLRARVRATER